MEFLLNISIGFTADQDQETRDRLLAEEHKEAEVLKRRGALVRIWRVPGSTDNWSVWRATDATQLHEIVSALPLFPWMKIEVHALAAHPLDPGDAGRAG
jgi:muconolactone D-isomerase